MKYLKQWDLPCFPDTKPSAQRRNVVGIAKTDKSGIFQLWMGGCGIGKYHSTSLPRAVEHLHDEVRQRLGDRLVAAQAELDYAKKQLQEWTEFPEQFAVRPEES